MHRSAGIDFAAVLHKVTPKSWPHSTLLFCVRTLSTVGGCLFAIGCAQPKTPTIDSSDQESLLTLMPTAIEIVRPFTTWADLDGTGGLDGLHVYVQPTNAAGDPIQSAGTIVVELYAFRPASADHRGERLGIWDFPLRSRSDQAARWSRATQMYELPVALPPDSSAIKPTHRYVLTVTLNPPLGDRRFDEYILEAPPPTSALTQPR